MPGQMESEPLLLAEKSSCFQTIVKKDVNDFKLRPSTKLESSEFKPEITKLSRVGLVTKT
jgi:hypothetical protein